ncbi:phosphohydrolase [Bacillus cereus]|uniref:HD domain-containing protein n=1 Tax=Bacillus cereus TaxID=1396 RepID=UPI000BEB8E9E|nr:HD domain-containing protein [Bacillus cereus]PDZ04540.1 phosphohydrolase [Bacillus cereus]PGU33926.1 phosphohydrolase [Bacillus cereus]PGY25906.1 phosphohydrolase [Bacillus cereus]
MQKTVAGIVIPDSKIAVEAQEILREYGNDLLWNHSNRVYVFGALQGKKADLKYDEELLYVSALFHDLGLTKKFSSPDKRFEVDGANAARSFLQQHGMDNESIRLVWDSIALHTTIGIAEYKEPQVSLIYSGVGYDVMGDGYDEISEEIREQVVSAFPRDNFKQKILPAFLEGFAHKPETTFGNIKADVCSLLLPGFKRKNFCDCVLHSPWKE